MKNYYNEYVNEVRADEKAVEEQFFSISYDDVKAMTREERNAVRACCEEHMDNNDNFKRYYAVYFNVVAVEDDEFREENEADLRAYFEKWFAGKSWEEIRSDEELYSRWDFYSDYHKDVYGFRPRNVVCGTRW